VHQSGGGVTLDSAPGAGSTITLLLPLSADQAAPAAEGAPLPIRAMRVLDILLVEDDAAVAALAEAMLRELGHRVEVADRPRAALERLRAGGPVSLLLTDVVMPGDMTGVDLARAATALRPDLPVLLSSGYTGQALASAEEAPWPLLRKPYTLDALAAALRDAVEPGTPPVLPR